MAIIVNNPGKFRQEAGIIYVGEITHPTGTTYKEFYEVIYGYRAMFKFLSFCQKEGFDTIRAIAEYWTNNTEQELTPFINSVTQQTGFLADQVLDLKSENVQYNIVEAISQYYNTVAAILEDVTAGYELFITTKIQ